MNTSPNIPLDWTEVERWVWERISAGKLADLKERDAGPKKLDPRSEDGWSEDRRLGAKFLQTILTQSDFVEATPFRGIRILGALVDDAPLDLEHARLQHPFWLEKSRILVDVSCRNLRVDGELSLKKSCVAGATSLYGVTIQESAYLTNATFKGDLNLRAAKIGSDLEMDGSTFEGKINLEWAKIGSVLHMDGSTFQEDVVLYGATVDGSVFLRGGATFKGELNLGAAKIGALLEMGGSTFEGTVNLNVATVGGAALFHPPEATFKGKLDLTGAKIGSNVEMDGSTFEKIVNLNRTTVDGSAFLRGGATFKSELNLVSARIGSVLQMDGATFEGDVIVSSATVDRSLFARDGATFKGDLNLASARIGSNLDVSGASFDRLVDLRGCRIYGAFNLGHSKDSVARWGNHASLRLRNAHVGAFQDWWEDNDANAWPRGYQLEGFSYDALGSTGVEKGKDTMLGRQVSDYIQWLAKDSGSSVQPYEHLARHFREAGAPDKSADVLYAARERQRRKAAGTGLRAAGLLFLRLTIGYGLGSRYFWVLGWVLAFTFLGAFVLIFLGSATIQQWLHVLFASLDQLLPIVTLDKAHDALIFGDPRATPPQEPQPYAVRIYFYVHKLAGWVLASFLVAGLAGLTQRN